MGFIAFAQGPEPCRMARVAAAPRLLKAVHALPYCNCRRPAPRPSRRHSMANIARFSPFDDTFEDLLRGIFVRPVGQETGGAAAQCRVDVTEGEKAFTLRAEIPGVKKEDINITIDGDEVAISAEVKNEKEVKDGERVLRAE